nr:hypothetical protein Iba_chr13aCG9590 [Ipomoea batatas]
MHGTIAQLRRARTGKPKPSPPPCHLRLFSDDSEPTSANSLRSSYDEALDGHMLNRRWRHSAGGYLFSSDEAVIVADGSAVDPSSGVVVHGIEILRLFMQFCTARRFFILLRVIHGAAAGSAASTSGGDATVKSQIPGIPLKPISGSSFTTLVAVARGSHRGHPPRAIITNVHVGRIISGELSIPPNFLTQTRKLPSSGRKPAEFPPECPKSS